MSDELSKMPADALAGLVAIAIDQRATDGAAVNAFSRLTGEPTPPTDDSETLPQIPGYEITAHVGHGGMGTVWRATQLATQRPVALKLMSASSFGSDRAGRRFEREVELAARLEHPNIARLYDSGRHHGIGYHATELIEGLHLDQYVRQHNLDNLQILALFAPICLAVHHAHQRGVIHRDLKPSNILVSDDGVPHVVDFGLAKSVADEGLDPTLTLEGQCAGTPAFMSPEQAAGNVNRIDTRSDVYGLGATLYCLLVGQLPHDQTGPRYQVLHRVATESPRAPRSLNAEFPSDLEALLLKSLDPDPDRRYGSAADLAREIERYLAHEPLEAAPPAAAYRMQKLLRKHRFGLGVAATLTTTLLAATSVSTWQAVRATHAKAAAEAAQQQITLQRDQILAEKQRADVQAATAGGFGDFYRILPVQFHASDEWNLRQQAEWCLQDLATRYDLAWSFFGQLIDVYRAMGQQEKVAYWQEKLRAVLGMEIDSTSRDLQALAPGSPASEKLRARHLNACLTLGRFREAAADFAALNKTDPYILGQKALLQLYLDDRESYQKTCQSMLAQYGEGEDAPAEIETVQACAVGGGTSDVEAMRRLAERATPGLNHAPITLLIKGMVEYQAANYQKAIEMLAAFRRKSGFSLTYEQPDANLPFIEADVVGTFFMAMAQYARDDVHEAEQELAQGRQKMAAYVPGPTSLNGDVGSSMWLLAQLASCDAETKLSKLIRPISPPSSLPSPPPAKPAASPKLITAMKGMFDLAESYQAEGKFQEAEDGYRTTLALQQRALGENDPGVAATLTALARTIRRASRSRFPEAEEHLRRAVQILQAYRDHETLSEAYHELGFVVGGKESEDSFRKSLALQRHAFGPYLPAYVRSLADHLAKAGNYAEAQALFKEELELLEMEGASRTRIAQARISLAEVLVRENKFADAHAVLFDTGSKLRIVGKLQAGDQSRLDALVAQFSRVSGNSSDGMPGSRGPE